MAKGWFFVGISLLSFWTAAAQNKASPTRNVVLVHGAWADGSGWKGVHDILVKDGYNVSIVQEPETSFKEDVSATKRSITQQDGPCVVVGHSYGGAVITEAANDPKVAALVYVAAHMPDAGENEADNGKRFPSDLSKSNAIKKTADGFTYLDPSQFHDYFAADLSAEQAAFMARSQVPNFADNFKAVITSPAWRSKPSWVVVAAKDRTINPDLERWYATRANSHRVEIQGASHSVYVSKPKEVAAVIEEAASTTRFFDTKSSDQRPDPTLSSISTLLTRNLHDVFGENDPARLRAAINEIFTEDCVFYEPNGAVHHGRDQIDHIAGAIRATHFDFQYQPISQPEELGNAGRVRWVEGLPGEKPAVAGTDFIIARDGRIAAVYLFFDKLP